jgi:hypothetical protein
MDNKARMGIGPIGDVLADFPRWLAWLGAIFHGLKQEAPRREQLRVLRDEIARMIDVIDKELDDDRCDG